MKILFVASECTPFVKTGGLADVVGSLPQALVKEGLELTVALPKYKDIPPNYKDKMKLTQTLTVPVGWRNQYCGVEKLYINDISYYFYDNEYYFNRPSLYSHYDEAERFTFFNRAVLESLPFLDYKPDIIHCHDWQSSLIGLFLKNHYRDDPFYQEIKNVLTIHNLKYQGIYAPSVLSDILGIDEESAMANNLEFYGDINYLKAGILYADLITTVSKSYALEIQTPYYGEKLEGLLKSRKEDLYGIVNGIDYKSYNPKTDPHLFTNYQKSLTKKEENKLQLQKMLGLEVNKTKPLMIIISRLVEQKGFDLISCMLDEIINLDLQLVVLGTGDYQYEQMFKEVCWENPTKVSTHITFNEDLARKMYAASDLFLMPSRFEPCGIGQLLALRYLSIPIVRETGGLKDTITSYDKETGEGNGFSFKNFNAHEMLYAIKKALSYYNHKATRQKLIDNILACNFSWQQSAKEYLKLYKNL